VLAALQAVGGVHGDRLAGGAAQGGADGLGLVAVGGTDGDALGGDGVAALFGHGDGGAFEQAAGDLGDRAHGLAVGAQGVPGGQFVPAPAVLGGLVEHRVDGRAQPASGVGEGAGVRGGACAELVERVEGRRDDRGRGGRQPPGDGQAVRADGGIVGEHDRDRAHGGVPGQAGPAAGVHGGERVELTGIAHEQAALEAVGDAQQHVRAHLVGLVDDGVLPGAFLDGGPLGGGADDHGAVVQIGDLLLHSPTRSSYAVPVHEDVHTDRYSVV